MNAVELFKEVEFNEHSNEVKNSFEYIYSVVEKYNLDNFEVMGHESYILDLSRRLFFKKLSTSNKKAITFVREQLGKNLDKDKKDNKIYLFSLEEDINWESIITNDLSKVNGYVIIAVRNKWSYKRLLGQGSQDTLNVRRLKKVLKNCGINILEERVALTPKYVFYLFLSLVFAKLGDSERHFKYSDKAQMCYLSEMSKFGYINLIVGRK